VVGEVTAELGYAQAEVATVLRVEFDVPVHLQENQLQTKTNVDIIINAIRM
jgi:hypothetical protein